MRTLLLCGLLISGCGDESGTLPDGAMPDSPTSMPCATPTGPGVEHQGRIDADETWTAADSPHVVTFGTQIYGGTLTIEPCAVVRIQKGYGFDVGGTPGGATSALIARGDSAERRVRFERDAADDPWGFIRVFATGTLDLEHVDLDGAGDPDTAPNLGGTIIGTGENEGLLRNVRVVDVKIERSGGFGLNLQARAGLTADSRDLVIHGSGFLPSGTNVDSRYPILTDGAGLSTLVPGTYTGNAVDEIYVFNANSLPDPEITFHALGLPYFMSNGFSMSPPETARDGGLSTLRIEPGVTMKFPYIDSGLTSFGLGSSNGDLPENIWAVRVIAQGTQAAPITFTSHEANPVAGDWAGIKWSGGAASGNIMSYVRVQYAGGDSGTQGFGCGPGDNDASIIFANWRPDDAFITSSTISDSAGGGIVSGWYTDAGGPALRSNNTFERIGNGCDVSRWADANGGCPLPPPICL